MLNIPVLTYMVYLLGELSWFSSPCSVADIPQTGIQAENSDKRSGRGMGQSEHKFLFMYFPSLPPEINYTIYVYAELQKKCVFVKVYLQ